MIENWRSAASLYSVQPAAVIAILGIVQTTILPVFAAQLPADAYALVNTALAVLLGIARLIRQGPDTAV